VPIGTKVWLYSKKPIGAVVGFAEISEMATLSPETIWRKFTLESAISRRAFAVYFADCELVTAIGLTAAVRLRKQIDLTRLKQISLGFHPPQFFARLATQTSVAKAFRQAGLEAERVGRVTGTQSGSL